MEISIIGTGYVGLVTGACLAEHGHAVTCVDVNPAKVAMITAAKAPIHEHGLPELLQRHVGRGLRATTDLAAAVAASDLSFITVGTPAASGRIDLQYVKRAAAEIGTALRHKPGYHAVVVKSTVIPGTTDGVVRSTLEAASGKRAGSAFGLGMNPEFLTEGRAVRDCLHPDRLVLGGIDARSHELLARLYAGFDAGVPRILTAPATAEMIKYASNALLATMISFSNEIARLCSAIGGIDALDVMCGVHQSGYLTQRDNAVRGTARIAAFLEAGCGFGGSCLPKDVTALIGQGEHYGLPMPLLRSVLDINRSQPDELLALIRRHYDTLHGVAVTVLGLSFKPDTDDLRESPALPVLRRLRDAGARLTAYDPVARPLCDADLAGVRLAESLDAAVADAEVVVLVTRWDEFHELPALLRRTRRTPLVVDGRRMLSPRDCARYEGIGLA